jgi:hypothetical protein
MDGNFGEADKAEREAARKLVHLSLFFFPRHSTSQVMKNELLFTWHTYVF